MTKNNYHFKVAKFLNSYFFQITYLVYRIPLYVIICVFGFLLSVIIPRKLDESIEQELPTNTKKDIYFLNFLSFFVWLIIILLIHNYA